MRKFIPGDLAIPIFSDLIELQIIYGVKSDDVFKSLLTKRSDELLVKARVQVAKIENELSQPTITKIEKELSQPNIIST